MTSRSRHARTRGTLALLVALAAGCDAPTGLAEDEMVGVLDGRTLRFEASATMLSSPGQPDWLAVSGFRGDVSFVVRVLYSGAGSYPLDGSMVVLRTLVGGDVLTGSYRGRDGLSGTLVLSSAGGIGSEVRGTLHFEAFHQDGEPRYGEKVSFRDGRFVALLRGTPTR